MELLGKLLDKYIEVACKLPLLGLVFANLNKIYLRKYLKYTIIGWAIAAVISILLKAPVMDFFFICLSLFLICISLASIYSESFRALVLNESNRFENTVYILYFFIYTGVGGLLISGFALFGWFQKAI